MEKQWDKIVLGVGALLFLALGFFAFKTFQKKPENLAGKNDFWQEESPVSVKLIADGLVEKLQGDLLWSSPQLASGKGLDLFVARPALVLVDNPDPANPVLMDEEEPMLHQDVPNVYFTEYQLPYLREDVLSLDQDGDGFNNLEEYQGKTSPIDAADHPPEVNKLFVDSIVITGEIFEFHFRDQQEGGIIGVREMAPRRRGSGGSENLRAVWSEMISVGDFFGQNNVAPERFQLLEVMPGEVPSIVVRDTSLPEQARNSTFTLPYRQPTAIEEYTAVLRFDLFSRAGEIIEVPELGEFMLPGVEGQKFRLLHVDEVSQVVRIEQVDSNGEVVNELTIGKNGPQ